MGIQRSIEFPTGRTPDWPAVVSKLTEVDEPVILRMIDRMPAFPDETPEEGWEELRVGMSGGMVTLRRTPQGFLCITWGTDDPALLMSWNRLCWAAAVAGSGVIVDAVGQRTADQFLPELG
jgi:hypothetical protein